MTQLRTRLAGLAAPAVAALALVAIPSIAAAQVAASEANARHYSQRTLDQQRTDAEGSRIKSLDQKEELQASWEISRKFSGCAVGFNAERAQQFLDQGQAAYKGKRTELEDFLERAKGCMPTRVQLDRDFLKGTLSEVLLTGEDTAPAAIPAPGDAAKVTAFLKAVKVPEMIKTDPFIMTQMAFECRVGFAPVAARALIATEPGSQAEAGALSAMKAVTPQCNSFTEGLRQLPPLFERAYSSQALYHWIAFAGSSS